MMIKAGRGIERGKNHLSNQTDTAAAATGHSRRNPENSLIVIIVTREIRQRQTKWNLKYCNVTYLPIIIIKETTVC